jgi:hypothetical protein
MSQKEVTLATIVKKPVTIHPTSCATSPSTHNQRSKTRGYGEGEGRLIKDESSHHTLKYDVAVLEERWTLHACLGRKASRIRRHI